ncbi:hypothetical protein GGX14DRAFT_414302 [Mycena pura]|uniref:CCHC-type domain-containing protein n=1 Tax=Mycena pura TaxID=153505 RepID=A0AAD6YT59_9AGAR|nr:hypothetical protein GGX14DRAFT_414302 [Mycena pura]
MEVIDLTLDSPREDTEDKSRRNRRKKESSDRGEEEGKASEPKRRRESSRERRRHFKQEERDLRRSKDDRGSEYDREEDDGRRRRGSSRDRDRKRPRRKNAKDRERDLEPIPTETLFFIDDKPTQLTSADLYTSAPVNQEPRGLILPAHVSVFDETPNIILPTIEPDPHDDDYIEYLDYDNRKDFVRYYDEQTDEKRTKIVCKRCGEEDDHTVAECTVLICQTCGARDEHPTKSCNISKSCFTCGMRRNCPNRNSNNRYARTCNGCERCESSSHQTRECPTLWRLYVYVEDTEHEHILQTRREKKGLPLGEGGEGYIGEDVWCYNCGKSGHWGDDCQSYRPEQFVEHTAFSYRILSQGPFVVPEPRSSSPAPGELLPDAMDVSLPGGVENVGRQGRKKERERLARRAQQEEDDPEDWFQNSRSVNIRGASDRERAGKIPTGPRTMFPSSSAKESSRLSQLSVTKTPLVERLGDAIHDQHRANLKVPHSSSKSRSRDASHRSDRERDRDRGPRYRGGYSR